MKPRLVVMMSMICLTGALFGQADAPGLTPTPTPKRNWFGRVFHPSPKLPQYFPSYVRYKNQGGKRTIQLVSDSMIDLANPKPFAMEKSYDIEDGLAKFFQALVGDPPGTEVSEVAKPLLKLKRM